MTAHAHAWTPDIAPDHVCACGAVGVRRLDLAGSPIREIRDPLRERGFELRAEALLAEREGRWRDAGRESDGPTLAVDEYMAERHEEVRMGRKTPSTRHRWTTEDEEALRDAVAVVFADGTPARTESWSAVAGRLLPGLTLTPDACRTRWQVLLDRDREAARLRELALTAAEAAREARQEAAEERVVVEPDAWAALAGRIAAAEQEAADELTAALCGLRADMRDHGMRIVALAERLERIEAYVAALAAAWDVTRERPSAA